MGEFKAGVKMSFGGVKSRLSACKIWTISQTVCFALCATNMDREPKHCQSRYHGQKTAKHADLFLLRSISRSTVQERPQCGYQKLKWRKWIIVRANMNELILEMLGRILKSLMFMSTPSSAQRDPITLNKTLKRHPVTSLAAEFCCPSLAGLVTTVTCGELRSAATTC